MDMGNILRVATWEGGKWVGVTGERIKKYNW